MSRVCPRKPLFLLCASMISVSRILRICLETFFFTKTSKVSQFVMGTYTYLVPKEEGARPYGWVAYQDFNNTMRNILFASDFIPLFWRWIPVAAIIAVNAFQTIGFVSVVQLLLAESFPTEIRFMRYHQISVYIIIDQTCEVRKNTPPYMHPE